jgi:hypothetical protein
VPACDQLPDCISLPAQFRPAAKSCVVTTFRMKCYVNRTTGAIPADRSVSMSAIRRCSMADDRMEVVPFTVVARVGRIDGSKFGSIDLGVAGLCAGNGRGRRTIIAPGFNVESHV